MRRPKQFHQSHEYGKEEEKMARCKFCGYKCKTEQGVRAHLKRCEEYLKSKTLSALSTVPKAASTPSIEPNPSAVPDCAAPLRAFEKAMHEITTQRNASQTPQQLRRSILQAVKAQVVDRYQSSSGIVTSTMRGAAKMAIEQQLASLPLEELPFDETCELAAAIRDRRYGPTFKREAQAAKQQQAEHESLRRKQIEDMATG